ncbi:SDR family NAD(P)-dependent oxidoreductase [Rhodococcoides kyotonense]|uniref:NAD(P)-dependent dehydrogenase, short-chain alcohol dehydrogenase family n=1 Tax=Rhodococcoides kyotonense TaxID=398843 RepID=A0A239N997_9NOCA|nr:SDR family oxidoreductase [Rhodococcus kyotonensis]SNT51004.1 NAD(P)-dependent dehydrogenase, short-chain alcohol dehydrogenase family [Rhodococcus kyotonensis]
MSTEPNPRPDDASATRNVLITGASRGIGRATAVAFAASGHRVAVHYATGSDAARETVELLDGTGHITIAGDLSTTTGGPDLVAEAVERLGGLDVLVNNAAVGPTSTNSHNITDASFEQWESQWREMVQVNLIGAAHLSWAFARHLIDRGRPGAIVQVGSRGALRGEPDFPAYGASKAGLHAFGQSMAIALAPHGISVTAVAPGFISSDRQHEKLAGPQGDEIRRQSPFGRVGTPDEVASTILYLASPDAAWCSGTVVDVNGASYLHP